MLKFTVDHILQEFYTLFMTRFRTYKIASPPLTKMTSKDDIKGLVSLKFLRPWSQGSSSGAGGGAAAKQVKWFNKCSWTCQICGTTVTTNSSAFFKHVAEHQVSREILWKFNFRILRNGQKTFSKQIKSWEFVECFLFCFEGQFVAVLRIRDILICTWVPDL